MRWCKLLSIGGWSTCFKWPIRLESDLVLLTERSILVSGSLKRAFPHWSLRLKRWHHKLVMRLRLLQLITTSVVLLLVSTRKHRVLVCCYNTSIVVVIWGFLWIYPILLTGRIYATSQLGIRNIYHWCYFSSYGLLRALLFRFWARYERWIGWRASSTAAAIRRRLNLWDNRLKQLFRLKLLDNNILQVCKLLLKLLLHDLLSYCSGSYHCPFRQTGF